MKIVEDDLQRIGRWVTLQCESLHTKLGMLLTNCVDLSYPVDYLRGAHFTARPATLQRVHSGHGLPTDAHSLPLRLQSKLTSWAR